MNINTSVSQNFASAAQLVNSNRQLVNVYKFDVNQQSAVQVALTSVAADAQVNLYLYNDNKLIIERDENPFPGMDKTVSASLRPGTYYVMVKYISSFNDNDVNDYYHLRVSN
jgi:hypothetical protein